MASYKDGSNMDKVNKSISILSDLCDQLFNVISNDNPELLAKHLELRKTFNQAQEQLEEFREIIRRKTIFENDNKK